MTREEAIEELKMFKGHTFNKTEEALDMAIEALELVTSYEGTINKLTQALNQQRLISVDEKLPEKDDLYLVYFDDGEYELSYCCKGTFSYSGVIAWMPLPELYKAESEVSE